MDRVWIELDERVKGGAFFVVRVDPPEILLEERVAGQPLRCEPGFDSRDRCFLHLKRLRPLRAARKDRDERGCGDDEQELRHGGDLTSASGVVVHSSTP